jgi:PASTA domain
VAEQQPQVSRGITRLRPTGVQWHLGQDLIERTRLTEDIEPIPGTATTGFNAHGNTIIPSPRVIAIYWGRDWGSPATGMNAGATTMDRFLATVVDSPYMDNLGQYSCGRGTFVGSTWVDHATTMPQTLKFDQLRQILFNWLMAGMAPENPPESPALSLLYFIFPPSEITLTDNNGNGGFCGYHWHGAFSPFFENMIFAVVDPTGGTSAVSHELVEACTDPTGNGWYSDDDGSEIGDVCSSCGSQTLTLAGFELASYWLVDQGRCLQQSDLVTHPLATVPDVIGLPQLQAEQALVAAGFVPHVRDVVDNTCNSIGLVTGEQPPGGTSLPLTSAVTIWVGTRPPHPCP